MQTTAYCCLSLAEEDICCFSWCAKPGIQKPHWDRLSGRQHHLNPQDAEKCCKCTFCTHAHIIQQTHTLFWLKSWYSPTPLSPFLSLALPTSSFPLSSCPVWPPLLLGKARRHSGLRSGGPPWNSGLRVCLNGSIHWFLSFKWLQVRDSAEGPTELSGCVESQPVQLKRCIEGPTLRLSSSTERLMAELPAEA